MIANEEIKRSSGLRYCARKVSSFIKKVTSFILTKKNVSCITPEKQAFFNFDWEEQLLLLVEIGDNAV